MAKIALLIGVDDSRSSSNARRGAGKDVMAMKQVLQDPEMGHFTEVRALNNPDPLTMQEAIETLFSDRHPDDLALLYFSGQGVKNSQGKLYLASCINRTDTQGRLVQSTAVPTTFIQDVMNSSRAHQQVVILDCWFGSALAEEGSEENSSVDVKQLGGQHQVVLLASTLTNGSPQHLSELSAFTEYLTQGLETGAADLDNDGAIAIDEWHEYTKQNLQAVATNTQTEIYTVKSGHKILLAKARIGDPKLKYHQEVKRRLNRGDSVITRGILDVVRDRLGLLPEDAAAIEARVRNPQQESQPQPRELGASELVSGSRRQSHLTPRVALKEVVPVPTRPITPALETPHSTQVKVALLIGVSDYGPGFTSLPGTAKDVEAMQRVLQHLEKSEFAQVQTLNNPDSLVMQQAIETLFSDRDRDDLVLLYFSGHGVKDDRGKLYLTTGVTRKDTQGRLIKSTAVPASFLQDVMSDSQSQQQVVILDCWFGEAFSKNWLAENEGVDIKTQLGGPGRVVLASSTSTQSAFEQKGPNISTYTDYLVEGLETGAADLDDNGVITLDELHEYTRRKVQKSAPATQPEIYGLTGNQILLAKAPTNDVRLKYRKEVERCASYGGLSIVSRSILDVLREKLELTPEEAVAIEVQVLKPHQAYQKKLQRYAQVLVEAVQQEYPLRDDTRSRFKRFQQVLGLREEDVALIEAQVARQVKGQSPQTLTQEPQTTHTNEAVAPSSSSSPLASQAAGLDTTRGNLNKSASVVKPSVFTTRNLWLLIGAGSALLTLAGIVYGLRQWQNSQRLKTIQTLAEQRNYEECLAQAQAVPADRDPVVQKLLQQCAAGANWQNAQDQTLAGDYAGTVWSVAIRPRAEARPGVAVAGSNPEILASASGATAKLWNLRTQKLLRTLSGHRDIVWSVAISPDGQTLASGSGDQTIKLWNLQTGELLRTLSGHTSQVLSVAISPDGQTLASGSGDQTINLWNLQTGELLRTLSGHTDTVRSIAIGPDGQTLASGSGDQTIKLWNLQTGKLLRTLSGHTGRVLSVAISPNGQALATASNDNTIKLWSLQTGKLLRTLRGHSDHVNSIAVSLDGQTLVSGSEDQTIKLWNLQIGKLRRTLSGDDDIYAVAFQDRQTFVSGNKEGNIKLWRRY